MDRTHSSAPTPLARRLLEQVLAAARQAGIGQAELARRAGLSPETLSRAKRRANMDLATLEALAGALDLHVALLPPTPGTRPQVGAPLSQPRFGLAWSNRQASEAVLVRRALATGRFDAVLEATRRDGLDFVKARLDELARSGELSARGVDRATTLVRNIEKGLSHGTGNPLAA